jgi:hypothetical protein
MASGQALRERFGSDPTAVFVKVLQDAGEPLTAKKIIDAVAEHGVARSAVQAKWAAFQKSVARFHPNLARPNARMYQWRAEPGGDDAKVRAARERQLKLDALHAVAELAGEVEELAYDSGDAELIVERLRARVRAAELAQLGNPGDATTFDPRRHDAMGPRPADGAPVTVMRPGYAWVENGSSLVLRKALVVGD